MKNPFEAHGIGRITPTRLNLFAACPALWVMENLLGRKTPPGAAAHRGTASEAGIVAGLLDPDLRIEDCQEIALHRFHELTALCGDPRREKEADAVPGIVAQGLEEFRPWGAPSSCQGEVEWRIEGIPVPCYGHYDAIWEGYGRIIDFKSQLKLSSTIKTGHARQIGLYKAALSDNLDAGIAYITPTKRAVYRLEEHRAHVRALERIAHALMRFLAVSADPLELAAITVPDIDSFYFSDPVTRQHAFEVFGV